MLINNKKTLGIENILNLIILCLITTLLIIAVLNIIGIREMNWSILPASISLVLSILGYGYGLWISFNSESYDFLSFKIGNNLRL